PPIPKAIITSNTVSNMKVMPPRFNKLSINGTPEEISLPLYNILILSTKGMPWNQTAHIAPSKIPNNITGTEGIFNASSTITTYNGIDIHHEMLNWSFN